MLKSSYLESKKAIEDKLISNNVPQDQAATVADVMATADLYGVTTHGSRILDSHISRVTQNGYNLAPDFKVLREGSGFTAIDGDNAFGFVSAKHCMEYAAKRAKGNGIHFVLCKTNNTFGPAFYYPLKIAKQGMIGIITSNSPAQMAPVGGREKIVGTNPFSAVIPVPGEDPIIIDMASSVVAKSKFKEYKEQGKPLPDGWALDENGKPTNDPDEGMKGLILPAGGYKGYAMALLIDILAGVLSGSAYLNKVGRFYTEDKKGMNVGFCCIAIDPYAVIGEEYDQRIKDFVKTIRTSKSIEGETVSLPGDREHKAKRTNG